MFLSKHGNGVFLWEIFAVTYFVKKTSSTAFTYALNISLVQLEGC